MTDVPQERHQPAGRVRVALIEGAQKLGNLVHQPKMIPAPGRDRQQTAMQKKSLQGGKLTTMPYCSRQVGNVPAGVLISRAEPSTEVCMGASPSVGPRAKSVPSFDQIALRPAKGHSPVAAP
jgi:hypothetical protein